MASQGVVALLGAFVGTGNSTQVSLWGKFNFYVYGTFSGTVVLERSFDDGANWIPIVSVTTPNGTEYEEIEPGMLYRARCSVFTSGTINYRIAQSPYRLNY